MRIVRHTAPQVSIDYVLNGFANSESVMQTYKPQQYGGSRIRASRIAQAGPYREYERQS